MVAGAQAAGAFDLLEYAFRASPTLGSRVRAARALPPRGPGRSRGDPRRGRRAGDGRLHPGAARPAPPATGQLLPLRLAAHRARGNRPGRPRPPGDARALPRARDASSGSSARSAGRSSTSAAEAASSSTATRWACARTRPDPGLVSVLGQPPAPPGAAPRWRRPFAAAVRARVEDDLPSGEVTAARVAAELGMSARTLDRRLAAEGTSFRARARRRAPRARRAAPPRPADEARRDRLPARLLGVERLPSLVQAMDRPHAAGVPPRGGGLSARTAAAPGPRGVRSRRRLSSALMMASARSRFVCLELEDLLLDGVAGDQPVGEDVARSGRCGGRGRWPGPRRPGSTRGRGGTRSRRRSGSGRGRRP